MEILLEFIIGRYSVNNIGYADNIVLMTDRKKTASRPKHSSNGSQEERTISCKKTECQ